MNTIANMQVAAQACPKDSWVTCGNTILGWLMGLGAVLAVIAVLIVAGKMVQANFTGDPWIAARGMGELPWVLLGVIMLLIAAPLIALLLRGVEPANEKSQWDQYLRDHAPKATKTPDNDRPSNGTDNPPSIQV